MLPSPLDAVDFDEEMKILAEGFSDTEIQVPSTSLSSLVPSPFEQNSFSEPRFPVQAELCPSYDPSSTIRPPTPNSSPYPAGGSVQTSPDFTNPLNQEWKREVVKSKTIKNRKDVYYRPPDNPYKRLRSKQEVKKYRKNFLFLFLKYQN